MMEVFRGLHSKFVGLFDTLDRDLKCDVQQAEDDLEAHFHCVELVLHKTALPSIAPRVKYSLQRFCDISSLLAVLRQPTDTLADTSKNKLEVWQDLKVLSFARACAAVLSLTIVSMQMRTMLTVLSRQLFLERAMSGTKAGEGWPALGIEAQEFFLSLVEKGFGYGGIQQLVSVVKETTHERIGDVALSKTMTKHDLRSVLTDLKKKTVPKVVRRGGDLKVGGGLETDEVTDVTSTPNTSVLSQSLLPSNEVVAEMWLQRVAANANAGSSDVGTNETYVARDSKTLDLILCMVTEMRTVVSSGGFIHALEDAIGRAWNVFMELADEDLYEVKEIDAMPVAKLVPALSNLSGEILNAPDAFFGAVASSPKVLELTREMW
tara:strand:+ start:34818 stop:35951 length:1134 start_codon:yes stop_codon:yes gene_type:complete